ncbi:MAG: hypothetical protein ABSC53_11585 [Bacteroidota bacterium]|jgi:hypothetical protein
MSKNQSPEKLWWATPPSLVGPLILIIFFIGVALVAMFVASGKIDAAILTSLGVIVFIFVAVADLLAELIAIGRRIDKSLESKSH